MLEVDPGSWLNKSWTVTLVEYCLNELRRNLGVLSWIPFFVKEGSHNDNFRRNYCGTEKME